MFDPHKTQRLLSTIIAGLQAGDESKYVPARQLIDAWLADGKPEVDKAERLDRMILLLKGFKAGVIDKLVQKRQARNN